LSPHEPLVQVALGAQLIVGPQMTLQAVPPHAYGKHVVDAGVEQ
jgi:hypothetical protein